MEDGTRKRVARRWTCWRSRSTSEPVATSRRRRRGAAVLDTAVPRPCVIGRDLGAGANSLGLRGGCREKKCPCGHLTTALRIDSLCGSLAGSHDRTLLICRSAQASDCSHLTTKRRLSGFTRQPPRKARPRTRVSSARTGLSKPRPGSRRSAAWIPSIPALGARRGRVRRLPHCRRDRSGHDAAAVAVRSGEAEVRSSAPRSWMWPVVRDWEVSGEANQIPRGDRSWQFRSRWQGFALAHHGADAWAWSGIGRVTRSVQAVNASGIPFPGRTGGHLPAAAEARSQSAVALAE
jgi:hypothetical protein